VGYPEMHKRRATLNYAFAKPCWQKYLHISETALTLLPYCCDVKVIGLQTGFKLFITTSVLQIGMGPAVSTSFEILKKGSCVNKT
jgi:hypothetical protein